MWRFDRLADDTELTHSISTFFAIEKNEFIVDLTRKVMWLNFCQTSRRKQMPSPNKFFDAV